MLRLLLRVRFRSLDGQKVRGMNHIVLCSDFLHGLLHDGGINVRKLTH